ncbi:MAG: hypothetical protein HY856_13650 [Burkholderiales bacterium]|nr:hypothetical protein [Burkholderiales bacterium]
MSDKTLIPNDFANVTPSDTEVLSSFTIGLFVGTGGAVVVEGVSGVASTYQAQSGQYLTGRFRRVRATGTTASGIVAQLATP